MDITSLLITLAGIIFIVALYIISRVSQSKLPKKQTSILPNLKNEEGSRFTSVLDDIPALDGSTPDPDTFVQENVVTKNDEEVANADDLAQKEATSVKKVEQQQYILFVAGRNEEGLDGKLVKQALEKNGLVLGDMDIYHYYPEKDSETEKYSLFRIANGVAPWTLKPEDLLGKKIAGLSIVMTTPTEINDSEAMSLFILLSEKICRQIGGVLKNQQQQLFTAKEKKNLLHSFKN